MMSGTVLAKSHLHEKEKRWFAIYTKFKCEKYVVQHLSKKGIEAYIPLLKQTKRYTRKIKHVEIPLINCYAFVKINKSEYVPVLETEYVHRFIRQRKDLISIPEKEILMLRRIVGEYEELEAAPCNFEAGQQVEIVAGNLTGIRGTLLEKKGKKNFVVRLETIGFQLIMDIDRSVLRPLSQLALLS